MSEDELRKSVFEALNTAVFEQGYDEILEWTAVEMAGDLIAYSSEHENCQLFALIPHCQAWIDEYGRPV